MNVGGNLKVLRKRKGASQEETASALKMTRSTYSGYENGVAQPNLDSILALSDHYSVSIDDLIKKNLTELTEAQLTLVVEGSRADTKGTKLRILTSIVDQNDEEVIEMIPQKASAGYVNGYADPEYLKDPSNF